MDDYLCLSMDNATISGNTATWNVIPTYYSNQRSNVCFLSLDRCNFSFLGTSGGQFFQGDTSTIVRTNLTGQNQQTSDNSLTVLDILKTNTHAIITEQTTTSPNGSKTTTPFAVSLEHIVSKHSNDGSMRLLVSARPTSISLTFLHEDLVSIQPDIIDHTMSFVILRFEYENTNSFTKEYTGSFSNNF